MIGTFLRCVGLVAAMLLVGMAIGWTFEYTGVYQRQQETRLRNELINLGPARVLDVSIANDAEGREISLATCQFRNGQEIDANAIGWAVKLGTWWILDWDRNVGYHLNCQTFPEDDLKQ